MKKQIEELEKVLNESKIHCKNWKNKRLYFSGLDKDINAYLTFDEPEQEAEHLLAGTSLKVFSNAEQSPKWLANRAKQVKHIIMLKIQETGVTHSGKPFEVCENWQDVIL